MKIVARQMCCRAIQRWFRDEGLQRSVERRDAHPSQALLAQSHALLAAPTLFGVEIGFNLPAFLIALIITTVLVIGIKESAKFNTSIVVLKLAVVLFVIFVGAHYVNRANWGTDWHSFAPFGLAGIGQAAGLVFFAYIGFDAVSTTAQRRRIRSVICQ